MHYEDEVTYGAEILPDNSSGAVLWPEGENSSMSLLSVPEMVKSPNN